MPHMGVVQRAEVQRVHQGDGSGPHGEDVAQDAADAGGRPLIGLDGRGVVVALHLHGDPQTVPDVHYPGVLPRALQHLGRPGGEQLQQRLGILVGAVFGPQHREDAQLGIAGGPPHYPLDAVELLLAEPEALGQFYIYGRFLMFGHVISSGLKVAVYWRLPGRRSFGNWPSARSGNWPGACGAVS